MSFPSIVPLADDAVLLRLGEQMDDGMNLRVHQLATRLRELAPDWLQDLVPAYCSLAVFFDTGALGADAHAQVAATLWTLLDASSSQAPIQPGRQVELPVCYGGEFGPDLEAAAATLGLSAQAVVQRHHAPEYRVAMIGFAPGFPYLSGLDPALALPRLATPRVRVEAGSVAIGGAQTGLYPLPGPGGWRVIGRCPLRLFDPTRTVPSLLAPGDRVRFVPIDVADYRRLAET